MLERIYDTPIQCLAGDASPETADFCRNYFVMNNTATVERIRGSKLQFAEKDMDIFLRIIKYQVSAQFTGEKGENDEPSGFVPEHWIKSSAEVILM